MLVLCGDRAWFLPNPGSHTVHLPLFWAAYQVDEWPVSMLTAEESEKAMLFNIESYGLVPGVDITAKIFL